jgi:hypothetical protein
LKEEDGCPAGLFGGGHPSVGEVGLANYVAWANATKRPSAPQAGIHLTIGSRENLGAGRGSKRRTFMVRESKRRQLSEIERGQAAGDAVDMTARVLLNRCS